VRTTRAKYYGVSQRTIARVVSVNDLHAVWQPRLSWVVRAGSADETSKLERLGAAGLSGLFMLTSDSENACGARLPTVVADAAAIEWNDVVAMTPDRQQLQVLYRESDSHHTVFLTNRCNSRCVMCSQPPTPADDSWLVEEAKQIAVHIRCAPDVLGFTGGEPLLLGDKLREVLQVFLATLESTTFDVLTNGRLLHDRALAKALLDGLPQRFCWMVPLYGHADFLHDEVVQAAGAFDQTIDGLLTLHSYSQRVQLRIVLFEPYLTS
jgi:Radical SAM superfamily